MRPFVLLAAEVTEPTPAAALHCARTGQSAFESMHRCHFYEHLAGRPDHDELWEQSMSGRAAHLRNGLAAAVDWTGVDTVIDVGGSHGATSA